MLHKNGRKLKCIKPVFFNKLCSTKLTYIVSSNIPLNCNKQLSKRTILKATLGLCRPGGSKQLPEIGKARHAVSLQALLAEGRMVQITPDKRNK